MRTTSPLIPTRENDIASNTYGDYGTASNSSFIAREYGTASLYTFHATDPERGDVDWSLTGPDRDDFSISETGVLSFASSTDYEGPTDSNRDNVYEITVVAMDDALNSATLDMVVTVTEQGVRISEAAGTSDLTG